MGNTMDSSGFSPLLFQTHFNTDSKGFGAFTNPNLEVPNVYIPILATFTFSNMKIIIRYSRRQQCLYPVSFFGISI